mmetsp:Transcript_16585/g.29758  ORF Transcript_16585/g.29758 Transcript_16585/m.29758 type:complete len:249 (+) Transcript_16585:156-902(+)|eukprot:CAMPEP_0197530196 /NCGR_PEP_ID=MMETSP1318-20131121/31035_1 /TAXON_ID=552666 /ORGANISM="Partenskyella glossopodia, Strain RCC365" /LENGTH=248 /DNA_ID=CAMNT_0043085915 /DNA_START=68 /DNA_END=814 /DNA_ORIENTATION=-
MPAKKSGKAKKVSPEELQYNDPEQLAEYRRLTASIGKEMIQEVEKAFDKIDEHFKELALDQFKKEGIEFSTKRAGQMIMKWRMDNILTKDHLEMVWLKLGFKWTTEQLETQLFDLHRPRAVVKQGTVLWDVNKAMTKLDFLKIFVIVMQNKDYRHKALSDALRELGDAHTGRVTPSQIRFGMVDLQLKNREGQPLTEAEILHILKISGIKPEDEKFSKIECSTLAKSILDGIASKKKKGKKKKKKKKA